MIPLVSIDGTLHLSRLWNLYPEMRRILRLLVTGGAGFIGSNFVRRVLDRTYEGFTSVAVLDNLTYAGNLNTLKSISNQELRFIKGDICDEVLLDKLLPDFDIVVNFAAESHVDRSISNATPFIETNVLGLHTLLDSARKHSIQRFVQVSTDEVYGSVSLESSSEVDTLWPNSPYSASKAAGDLLCRAAFMTYGQDVVVTRSCNNFGIFQNREKFIPRIITNLIEERTIPIYGSGQNIREWISIDDHCRGIYLSLIKGQAGEIYNLGSGFRLSNIEVAKGLIEIFGKDDDVIEFVPDRPGHDFRYALDSEKAKSFLDFKIEREFFSDLNKTVEWYRENLEDWSSVS
jgi:dTDP-glucose 4,6-dehydratase